MLIYPAIDLLDGHCVRLLRGSYTEVTEFSRDPVSVARGFVAAGAEALHVVDLDGAREGRPVNSEAILRIREACAVPLHVGGGLRRAADLALYLQAGVERVILGTTAATNPELLAAMVQKYGANSLLAAVDLRDGKVVVEGWQQETEKDIDAFLTALGSQGVTNVIYTDTTRDGALVGPDLVGAQRVISLGFRTIVAGGVSTLKDIRSLRSIGAAGSVVGSALYRSKMRLRDAIEAGAGPC